jgi:hypothetical protein
LASPDPKAKSSSPIIEEFKVTDLFGAISYDLRFGTEWLEKYIRAEARVDNLNKIEFFKAIIARLQV